MPAAPGQAMPVDILYFVFSVFWFVRTAGKLLHPGGTSGGGYSSCFYNLFGTARFMSAPHRFLKVTWKGYCVLIEISVQHPRRPYSRTDTYTSQAARKIAELLFYPETCPFDHPLHHPVKSAVLVTYMDDGLFSHRQSGLLAHAVNPFIQFALV